MSDTLKNGLDHLRIGSNLGYSGPVSASPNRKSVLPGAGADSAIWGTLRPTLSG
jgi:hypothetical protein